jgi:2-polyprenyl-3-methyl-5-hydroxy-6-metoxy-1,4-benzoquinol methylase
LFAHELRWQYISSQLQPEDDAPEPFWDYEDRDAREDYAPSMIKYTLFAKLMVGVAMTSTFVDLGCGPGAYMGRFLYSNRRKVEHYIGVDYREPKPDYKPHFPADFMKGDVTEWKTYETVLALLGERKPDIISTLEVIEHMSKEKGIMFLDNIQKLAAPYTTIFLSTPCHDNVHLPHDHVYEWQHAELKEELEKRFTIEANYGTFASQKDIKHVLTPAEHEVFESLSEYYDASMLSTIFAPMHPAESRNSIWRLRLAE